MVGKPGSALGWGREERRTGRGRCVIADVALRGGEVVLREAPFAAVLAKSEQSRRCSFSLEAEAKLLRCPKTGARFRSQEERQYAMAEYYDCEQRACERLASAGHSLDELPLTLRLALRLLWRAGCGKASDGLIPWLTLQDHWAELKERRREELRGLGELGVDIYRKGLRQEDMAKIPLDGLSVAKLVALLPVNAITIADEELQDIGLGLFLGASAFNHSEEPNCTQSFEGRELVIRARVPVRKGEELTITYAELAEASRLRSAQLRSQYFFDPTPAEGDSSSRPAAAVAARDEKLCAVLSGGLGQQEVLKQGVIWSPDQGVASAVAAAAEEEEEEEARLWLGQLHSQWCAVGDLEDRRAKLEGCRRLWAAACGGEGARFQLGPGHSMRLHVTRLAMDLAVEEELWQEAATWGRAVCACEALVYPEPWPVPALSCARLAKLELHLGSPAAACSAGQVALRLFGALGMQEGKVCKELRQMLAIAEAESRACRDAHAAAKGVEGPGSTKKPALADACQSMNPVAVSVAVCDVNALD